jgi:hypothetical protein
MLKFIKNWFKKKITLILAPNYGSRSLHLSLSYPFATFLVLLIVSIFTTGIYFTNLYIGYIQAVDANKKLVEEKTYYSSQVEEALDMLHNVQNIDQ